MMALADRALMLNPSFARGWNISASLRLFAGQPDVAIEHAEIAMRLSPRVRVGPLFSIIGGAYFLSRRFDEAVQKLRLAIQDDPTYPQPHRALAASYAHMGKLDDARDIVTRLRTITSLVIPDVNHPNAEYNELLLSGLRLALGKPD